MQSDGKISISSMPQHDRPVVDAVANVIVEVHRTARKLAVGRGGIKGGGGESELSGGNMKAAPSAATDTICTIWQDPVNDQVAEGHF